MAAISFSKAVYETKYMDDPYTEQDYSKLEIAIDQLSEDIKQQVFGQAPEVDRIVWKKKAFTTDLAWLFKIETIRDKVHETAGTPILHVNEAEAQRLLLRIQRE